MGDAVAAAIGGFLQGVGRLGPGDALMIAVGCALLYLGIRRGLEPLLLVPIGFGAVLVNIPGSGLMAPGGILRVVYDAGVATELFPVLIFLGIGALTDFGPLFGDPKLLLLGAAGQLGIFITLLLALVIGFPLRDSVAVGVIGAQHGTPTPLTLPPPLVIAAPRHADVSPRPRPLLVFGLGFVAIVLYTAAGIAFGKIYGLLSGGPINPLIGAAGISAYPMAARVV